MSVTRLRSRSNDGQVSFGEYEFTIGYNFRSSLLYFANKCEWSVTYGMQSLHCVIW